MSVNHLAIHGRSFLLWATSWNFSGIKVAPVSKMWDFLHSGYPALQIYEKGTSGLWNSSLCVRKHLERLAWQREGKKWMQVRLLKDQRLFALLAVGWLPTVQQGAEGKISSRHNKIQKCQCKFCTWCAILFCHGTSEHCEWQVNIFHYNARPCCGSCPVLLARPFQRVNSQVI